MQTASFLSASSSMTSPTFLGHPQSRIPSSSLGARKQSFAGRISFNTKTNKSHRGAIFTTTTDAAKSSNSNNNNNTPRRLGSLRNPAGRGSRRVVMGANAVLDSNPGTKNGSSKSSDVGKFPTAAPPANNATATMADARPADRSTERIAKVCFIGPDRKGMMAGLSQLMFGSGCNILSSAQYVNEDNIFFQRMSIDFSKSFCGADNREAFESTIASMAKQFDLISWKISYTEDTHNVGILVSKLDHCLWDLLVRYKNNELKCEIPIIMSNHAELKYIADQFDIPFLHLPMVIVDDDKVLAKKKQEALIDAALTKYKVETLILARYMQIMSDDFCAKHAEHTINIHHSFLPAFEGGRPYHRAKERGVKLIGATAHYATAKLDAGPIIVQDVQPISHRDSVKDMVRKGKDLERVVLAKALRYHLESRVLVHENKTVVFD